MQTFFMQASMLDNASTDEQRNALRERLGDARIRHNAATGVLVAQFPVEGEDRDDACLAGAQLLRSALRETQLSPTIVTVAPAC